MVKRFNYSKRSVLMFIVAILISFATFYQYSSTDIFGSLHQILETTLNKDLIFLPFGILILSLSVDARSINIMRYKSYYRWFNVTKKKQSKIVLLYTLAYFITALFSTMISAYRSHANIEITIHIYYFILDVLKLYVLMKILSLMIIYSNAVQNKYANYGIVSVYILVQVIWIIEKFIFDEIVILRPISDTQLNIFGNILLIIPYLMLYQLIILIIKYLMDDNTEGEK